MDDQDFDEAHKSKEFSLSSTNTAFTERSKDIFQSLQFLEEKHKEHEKTREESCSAGKDLDNLHYMKSDPSDEDTEVLSKSKFKKPYALQSCASTSFKQHEASSVTDHDKQHQFSRNSRKRSHDEMQNDNRNQGSNNSPSQGRRNYSPLWRRGGKMNRNRVPDHKINPQKWTKYSLEDISEDDLSESANTWAAFSFLEDLKKQKAAKEGKTEEIEPADVEGGACSKGRITFKRPNKSSGSKNETRKACDTSNKNEAYNKLESDISTDSDMIESENSSEVTDKQTSAEKLKFRATKFNKSKRNIRIRERDPEED